MTAPDASRAPAGETAEPAAAGVRLRILYVTSSFPFGSYETFLVPELEELRRQGHVVWIVPMLPRGPVVHPAALSLLDDCLARPLLSREIARAAVREAARAPLPALRLFLRLWTSRTPAILAKNLAIYPKALWLAHVARQLRPDHLHAQWGGTSATMGLVAATISGTPWSFTVHRWDVVEDNLLATKLRAAAFVRSISRYWRDELCRLTNADDERLHVIHLGVPLPDFVRTEARHDEPLRIFVPAALIARKGHAYLIEAVELLAERGCSVLVGFAGDGPLRGWLESEVVQRRLGDAFVFLGQLSHDDVLGRLRDGRWDAVALASLSEGIPVALIEAMSYGIPTIGTRVDGVEELLGDGAGVLVPPRDPGALADAISALAADPALRAEVGRRGRERVEREFASETTVAELVGRFVEAAVPATRAGG